MTLKRHNALTSGLPVGHTVIMKHFEKNIRVIHAKHGKGRTIARVDAARCVVDFGRTFQVVNLCDLTPAIEAELKRGRL